MTHFPPAAVILIAAITCSAAIVAWVWLAERLDPPHRGRHDPFADPADRDDPHGEKYAAQLRGDDAAGPAWNGGTFEGASDIGLHGTGWLPELPPDPPPPDTGELPAATAYLGMPSSEYVDQLFGKYAEKSS